MKWIRRLLRWLECYRTHPRELARYSDMGDDYWCPVCNTTRLF